MSDAVRFDWARQDRTRLPEVVFAQGKQDAHLAQIAGDAVARQRSLLFTRLDAGQHQRLLAVLPRDGGAAAVLDYDASSRTAILGTSAAMSAAAPVGIVCAGSSDLPVALEAQRTLSFMGRRSALYADVGVAGLWRLLEVVPALREHPLLIAVAGMEGALFSVLAGLVPGLVIAVPTSVGYGVGNGGQAALSSALAGCSPGVVCVNIDNGFGAAAAVLKMPA